MKRLWTPWRMEYILSDKTDFETGCLFCSKARQGNDRENLILYRGQRTFIILNLYPYNNGHLMVVPYEHTRNVDELDEATLAEMMSEAKRAVQALEKAMSPDGFNIGINIGKSAGAGVDNHVHMHVVPRWVGDSNFMPVVSETRLIPEDPQTTYERLLQAGIAER
ncbi:MAG: HIT domain-containing protein [Chloroflexi bacterium]|nr:HIT domain-containing protein [Chloroflexota bacterium]MCL5107512.1 HIT domain-containing protein [Chloroflexota bacterium]